MGYRGRGRTLPGRVRRKASVLEQRVRKQL